MLLVPETLPRMVIREARRNDGRQTTAAAAARININVSHHRRFFLTFVARISREPVMSALMAIRVLVTTLTYPYVNNAYPLDTK